MASRLFVITIVAIFAFPAVECQAQKLKLPNFLPFKKKSQEVKPFKLSDRTKSNATGKKQNKLLDFLKPRPRNGQAAGANQFNTRSKKFFSKTNDGLDRFSAKTKKFFDDAWNPPKAHTAWWNQAPENGANNSDLKAMWPGAQRSQPGVQPHAVPAPRSARQYQYGQPKHRFK